MCDDDKFGSLKVYKIINGLISLEVYKIVNARISLEVWKFANLLKYYFAGANGNRAEEFQE